jgi:hypothetical protein
MQLVVVIHDFQGACRPAYDVIAQSTDLQQSGPQALEDHGTAARRRASSKHGMMQKGRA